LSNITKKLSDATHQCSCTGRFYKETGGQDYIWSDSGWWIKSIGLPLRGHSIILPLDVRNFDESEGAGEKRVNDHTARPLRKWIFRYHDGNRTHAAAALGVNRSTLHRVMDTAYVINGRLYTIKRKS